jgi:pyridoxamine 5'-phosphate oxidase
MPDFAKRTPLLELADLRENYTRGGLDEANCDSNPIRQFETWFREAQAADLKEPNAMVLSTATAAGRPSGRVVLLKEVDDLGFVFYTSYESRKAQELETNPSAALTFYWAELERQVRIEGTIERVSREKSEEYFLSRPLGHRLGAWVSQQSAKAHSRGEIEAKLQAVEKNFAQTEDLPAPPYWGGYRLVPDAIEFWQGRLNRLHDRILYRLSVADGWTMERLWP